MMHVVLKTSPSQIADWERLLRLHLGDRPLAVWPDVPHPAEVGYAAVWRPPPGFFAGYPNLRAIVSLAAGIDHLRADPSLPHEVPIIRLTGRALARQMVEYALYQVLRFHRRFALYEAQRRDRIWRSHRGPLAEDTRVGVLGLGQIGLEIAAELRRFGFDVAGWTRTNRALDFPVYAGRSELPAIMRRSDIVVCVLPLTAATRGLLDGAALAAMPPGGFLINIGRGEQVDEAALLELVRLGHLAGAALDVAAEEPLPPDSPLWDCPQIEITPHIAGDIQPRWAAAEVAQAIRAFAAGETPSGLVRPAIDD